LELNQVLVIKALLTSFGSMIVNCSSINSSVEEQRGRQQVFISTLYTISIDLSCSIVKTRSALPNLREELSI
jgi:hypothetical protein